MKGTTEDSKNLFGEIFYVEFIYVQKSTVKQTVTPSWVERGGGGDSGKCTVERHCKAGILVCSFDGEVVSAQGLKDLLSEYYQGKRNCRPQETTFAVCFLSFNLAGHSLP